MDYKAVYERWLAMIEAKDDIVGKDELLDELRSMNEEAVEDVFYQDLAFGTGGLRGTIGAGTNRMNVLTVAKASQGLANYLLKNYERPSVVIGFDSRLKSDIFAQEAAAVFAANGINVWAWNRLLPVPTVSYATRYIGTSAGVMITASHNPSKYNGYKVYGSDGCQITTEAAAEILAEIEKNDIFSDVKRMPYSVPIGIVCSGFLKILINCLERMSLDSGHRRFPDPPDSKMMFMIYTLISRSYRPDERFFPS